MYCVYVSAAAADYLRAEWDKYQQHGLCWWKDLYVCVCVCLCVCTETFGRLWCGWGGNVGEEASGLLSQRRRRGGCQNKKAGCSETLHKHLAAWIFLKYLALEEPNLLTETLWDALCCCDRCLCIRMKIIKARMLHSSSIRDRQELRGDHLIHIWDSQRYTKQYDSSLHTPLHTTIHHYTLVHTTIHHYTLVHIATHQYTPLH